MFLTTEMHQMLVNDQNNSKTGSCTEPLEDVLVSKYPDHGKYPIQNGKPQFHGKYPK